ncbi:MAG: S-formylglutathione hydrolase [Myxococcales bacterium]|nr:S-formylglutathione hydrolase [Myxococcales bacterium]
MGFEQVSAIRCFGGVQRVVKHDSRETKTPMSVAIFEPPGAGERPLPVVYFLSGLTCTEQNFITKAGAQRVAAELGLYVVAPDTSPRGAGAPGEDDDWDFGTGAGFYVDATTDGFRDHYRMYSYITEELPQLVHAELRTAGPERQSVMGHSMGGHGALVIGLRNPERYRAISAFAPICAPSQCPWGAKAFSGYLGDDREAWKAYDASELVRSTGHPESILIDQGVDDQFLAEQLLPERFAAAAEAAGQAFTLRMQPGYDHSYYFIASFVEDHLRHHAARLAD